MNDKTKQAAKDIVTELMNDIKRIFSQTEMVDPVGYFLTTDKDSNDQSTVTLQPIPGIDNCFKTLHNKEQLPMFIQKAAKSFRFALQEKNEKIIAVAVIQDAYYYAADKTDIDVTNAIPAAAHPLRKEAIVGMLYFEDSQMSFSYPYIKMQTRVLFEELMISESMAKRTRMENLFPYQEGV